MLHFNQEVIYHEGTLNVLPPNGISDQKDWTQLQAVLRWTITEVSPAQLSLAEAETNPESTALTIKGTVKMTWSATTQPLTLCASGTLLEDKSENAKSTVGMVAYGHPRARLLLRGPPRWPPVRYHRRHHPEPDDVKAAFPCMTIPPGDKGVAFSCAVSWGTLLGPLKQPGVEYQMPIAGDKYKLAFTPKEVGFAHETLTRWWNWGDLDGDLKDKKLRNLIDPRYGGPKGPVPDNVLQTFGSWEYPGDAAGNRLIHLLVHMDSTPHIVEFTE